MRKNTPPVVNDINQCLDHARILARGLQNTRRHDCELVQVFNSLAGDKTVGLLAYVIWRGRSRLLSSLRMTPTIRYDGECARGRHTRT